MLLQIIKDYRGECWFSIVSVIMHVRVLELESMWKNIAAHHKIYFKDIVCDKQSILGYYDYSRFIDTYGLYQIFSATQHSTYRPPAILRIAIFSSISPHRLLIKQLTAENAKYLNTQTTRKNKLLLYQTAKTNLQQYICTTNYTNCQPGDHIFCIFARISISDLENLDFYYKYIAFFGPIDKFYIPTGWQAILKQLTPTVHPMLQYLLESTDGHGMSTAHSSVRQSPAKFVKLCQFWLQ